ncbi:hypothetical protein HWV62_21322 [Athelia sp. TMB]|nr:hypothetical protein HWV62_21322 [Athelia sp. TMB]
MSKRAQLNFHSIPEHDSDDKDEDDAGPSTSRGPAPLLKPRAKHTRLTADSNVNSQTARTHYHEPMPSPAKAPPAPPPIWDETPATFDDASPHIDAAYTHHLDTVDLEPNSRAYTQADAPLLNWIPGIDSCLQEILRLEGRGDHMYDTVCPKCKERDPLYRCEDCYGAELYCSTCLVLIHARSPLHRVLFWNGVYFESVSLKSLGLRVQLGHDMYHCCGNPMPASNDDFTVIDSFGIHPVGLDYCGCETAQERTTQILRASWFPATNLNPKTAATFRVLETFHLLSFESKCSGFEFYYTLARLMDNTSAHAISDRYSAFMRMVREWRHIKMVKRAGQGHQSDGAAMYDPGKCAVMCPACPHPGRNLPDGWEHDKDRSWLYTLFLGIDANFRLKRKLVSSDAADPSLNRGTSSFVEESAFKEYLSGYDYQEEVPTNCVNHDAVKSANKSTAGLAATGAGTVDCARHNMKRPNAVGDLQKGENLLGTALLTFVVSYDICCQWSINLWKRMLLFPPEYHLDHEKLDFTFVVPKFHLAAHVARCQTAYSLNFTPGVGRTDGEAPERGWADIGHVASSTKEMGPGSRRDTLDDHFADWNHKKIVSIGPTLLRKIKVAVPERAAHVHNFVELSSHLSAAAVAGWTVEVEAWEKDNTMPNPFVSVTEEVTERQVKLALAQEEARELEHGEGSVVHDTLSPAVLITTGMDFLLQQRRLQVDGKQLTPGSTTLQRSKMQLRQNALRRKLSAWCKVQELYFPGLAAVRARSETTQAEGASPVEAHAIPLYLPSQMPTHIPVELKFYRYEWQLRKAQAFDALAALRQQLRLKAHLLGFKFRFDRGQKQNLRSSDVVSRVRVKIDESADRYRSAREALISLDAHIGEVGWEVLLPVLADDDIRQLGEGRVGESEGTRTLSWIWLSRGIEEVAEGTSAEDIQDILRIEWCKARARGMRWTEEILLLVEEMRRVLAYHEWHADWWDVLAFAKTGLSLAAEEGYTAYAFRQASIRRTLRNDCHLLWRNVADFVSGKIDATKL